MTPNQKTIRKAQRKYEKFRTFLMKPIYRLQQCRYDRKRDTNITTEVGKFPLYGNVVILLVYQPKGLPASLFHTLEYIKSEGFSAFVVLNSPIDELSYEKLKENCALIMKRPNFGYDFGGYRDAILYLNSKSNTFDSITCMNDSIWFPLFQSCDHLSQMFNIKGNLVGYSHCELSRGKASHLQSYLFMFKKKEFLESTTFLDYWSQLKISNSRYFTIRNCELKMTAYFKNRKHKIGWLFSDIDLEKYYENSSDKEIISAVQYVKDTGHHSASLFDDVSEEDVIEQRRILISGLKSGKLYRSVIGGEPSAVFYGLNFAAMKKSKDFIYEVQRKRSVDCGICEHFESSVKEEVMKQTI